MAKNELFKWRVRRGYVYYGPGNRDKNSQERVRAELRFAGSAFNATEAEVAPEKYKLTKIEALNSSEVPPPPPPRRVASQRRKVEAIDTMLKESPEVT